jgi:predicted nicotinamide N-methyase
MPFAPAQVPPDLLNVPPPGFPPGAALPSQIRRYLATRFDLCEHTLDAGGRRLRILGVRDVDRLTDAVPPAAFAVDERFPYWAELWTSSRVLAAEVVQHPGLRGMRVLELGCGLGLAGAAAAAAGAYVTLTDYEEDALLFARWSVLMSLPPEVAAATTVRLLDWRSPPALEPFPLVLGADLLYERRFHAPLLSCITALLAPGGTALLADPGRGIAGEFLNLAAAQGYSLATTSAARVNLHRLTRP